MALAVPSGRRATAAMKSTVSPAVTTPSATAVSRPRRPNRDGRGRTTTSRTRPAQASRSHAAPSGPTRSNRPTDRASPSCTHVMDPTAMRVPVRAWLRAVVDVLMTPVEPVMTVRVHVRNVDTTFENPEQSDHGPAPPRDAAAAVPPGVDARGRRGAGYHHLDRLPAGRRPRP